MCNNTSGIAGSTDSRMFTTVPLTWTRRNIDGYPRRQRPSGTDVRRSTPRRRQTARTSDSHARGKHGENGERRRIRAHAWTREHGRHRVKNTRGVCRERTTSEKTERKTDGRQLINPRKRTENKRTAQLNAQCRQPSRRTHSVTKVRRETGPVPGDGGRPFRNQRGGTRSALPEIPGPAIGRKSIVQIYTVFKFDKCTVTPCLHDYWFRETQITILMIKIIFVLILLIPITRTLGIISSYNIST